jgi:threonine dehydrogenase-like Zn-dependent dehydrogenase
MPLPTKRQVAARCGDGRIRLVEQDLPPLRPGTVLVEVHASLVSPGTEVGGWRALAARTKDPDTEAMPRPFGYSNAGVVMATGEEVTRFVGGDRVACIGGGYAQHADYAVVPQNLCVTLPPGASFVQGAYGMLSATALHALRRAEAEFGEQAAVAGLGLVGQLVTQMLKLAGCFVIGWDAIPLRLNIARELGIDAVTDIEVDDVVAVTRSFTNDTGLDLAVIAFGGDADAAVGNINRSLKVAPDTHRMGRIVVVGGARFTWPFGADANADIRRAGRTGPGYHDEDWETGASYPSTFMRWTTATNLELCMRLIASGRLNVDALTTHKIPFVDVEQQVAAAVEEPDTVLGMVFAMH